MKTSYDYSPLVEYDKIAINRKYFQGGQDLQKLRRNTIKQLIASYEETNDLRFQEEVIVFLLRLLQNDPYTKYSTDLTKIIRAEGVLLLDYAINNYSKLNMEIKRKVESNIRRIRPAYKLGTKRIKLTGKIRNDKDYQDFKSITASWEDISDKDLDNMSVAVARMHNKVISKINSKNYSFWARKLESFVGEVEEFHPEKVFQIGQFLASTLKENPQFSLEIKKSDSLQKHFYYATMYYASQSMSKENLINELKAAFIIPSKKEGAISLLVNLEYLSKSLVNLYIHSSENANDLSSFVRLIKNEKITIDLKKTIFVNSIRKLNKLESAEWLFRGYWVVEDVIGRLSKSELKSLVINLQFNKHDDYMVEQVLINIVKVDFEHMFNYFEILVEDDKLRLPYKFSKLADASKEHRIEIIDRFFPQIDGGYRGYSAVIKLLIPWLSSDVITRVQELLLEDFDGNLEKVLSLLKEYSGSQELDEIVRMIAVIAGDRVAEDELYYPLFRLIEFYGGVFVGEFARVDRLRAVLERVKLWRVEDEFERYFTSRVIKDIESYLARESERTHFDVEDRINKFELGSH